MLHRLATAYRTVFWVMQGSGLQCNNLYSMCREEQVLHRLATAYRTVFAKIDLTASDQHAGFALAAALQACQPLPCKLSAHLDCTCNM